MRGARPPARFVQQAPRYTPSYDDDEMTRDDFGNDLDEDDEFYGDNYSAMAPARGLSRQYSDIGRGPPLAQARSRSMNVAHRPNPPRQSRSRSTYFADAYNEPDDAPTHGPDIRTLLERLTLQQNEQLARNQELIEQNKELREQNRAIQARLEVVESRPSSSSAPSTDSERSVGPSIRGAALRGKKPVQRRSTRRTANFPDLPEPQPTDATPNEDPDPTDGAIHPVATSTAPSLDEELPSTSLDKKERTAVKKHVTETFRRTCGVPKTRPWPDPTVERKNPITREILLSPLKMMRPPGVSKTAVWDNQLLVTMAKKSFRGFKRDWKATNDAVAAKNAEDNDRKNRWYRRRCTKLKHVVTQVAAVPNKHGQSAATLTSTLNEQHLSDEASGPEDEAVESKDAWKVRMAIQHGVKDLSPASLKKYQFLEVLQSPWRSSQYSDISLELHSKWEASLSAREQGNFQYTRVRTDRKSPRIPVLAPFDFGISPEWLEMSLNDPTVAPLIADWNTFGNPDRFVSEMIHNGTAAHGAVADPRFNFDFGEKE
ncbi:hypothetical protein C8J57DRAFT_1729472, partial [Mycena rebaudengoi]